MIILVDPIYNPNFRSEFTSETKLGPGITMSKFLGARGTPTNIQAFRGQEQQLARNLYLHAEAMRVIAETSAFNSIRLVATEMSNVGTKVAYQVLGRNGKVDLQSSFDVAEFWKDYINYNKIQLAYDTYDPDGSVSVSIVLEFPSVPQSFDVRFTSTVETVFNNKVQANNELIEYTI